MIKNWLFAASLSLPLTFSPVAHADFSQFCTATHCFKVGDNVIVDVAQGRTTGTIQRIDSDGYVIVNTPSGFSNFQGAIAKLNWPVQEMNGFVVGQSVVVIVSQGRTTGTLARIDSDGNVIVNTPSGYTNYQGSIQGLIDIRGGAVVQTGPRAKVIAVGDTVVVEVAQGRTTGTVGRIDGDGTVIVNTPSGFSNYQGPISAVRTILTQSHGYKTGQTVGVTVTQGRTTGTIARIDSDGFVIVNTPSGFSNYQGKINHLRHILKALNGFVVGQTVVVNVSQGRTTGTIQQIESDGMVIVNTPSGFSNYNGPISGLIRTAQ